LLLTGIVRSEPGSIEATGEVPADHPLVSAGKAPCFLGLELGAQAAAALEALSRPSGSVAQAARIGYLVRVREARFLVADLPTGTQLRVTSTLEGAVPPLSIHRIRVSVGGVDCLWAILGTYGGGR
jgi:predicted hotdog family 3-hydroxylacyl-ACP dehydratase